MIYPFLSRALLAGVVAIALLAAPAAHAQTVVFDNGGSNIVDAFASDPTVPEFSADTFTFTGTTLVNSVQWFGLYSPENTPPLADNFTIAFYNTDATGTPSINPFAEFNVGNAVNRTPTGGVLTANGIDFTIFGYESTLTAPVTFNAGTYAIEIFNDTTGDDDIWFWGANSSTGGYFFRTSRTNAFEPFPENLSFRLVGTSVIPEPSALALLTPVLPLGVAAVRRRKRAA